MCSKDRNSPHKSGFVLIASLQTCLLNIMRRRSDLELNNSIIQYILNNVEYALPPLLQLQKQTWYTYLSIYKFFFMSQTEMNSTHTKNKQNPIYLYSYAHICSFLSYCFVLNSFLVSLYMLRKTNGPTCFGNCVSRDKEDPANRL